MMRALAPQADLRISRCPASESWGNKNHGNLLRAISLLVPRRPEARLLLTGAPASGVERVLAQIAELGLDDHVRLLGHQPREVLVSPMRHARALLFATLFEGFGIPPLEAFNLGTPVVASGAAGNAEMVGDAALIVDPHDPRSIADGIGRILDDADLRAELIERGRARTNKFSWRRSIETLMRSLWHAALEGRGRPAAHDAPTSDPCGLDPGC
jgi:glycosyltransferase involved in cell wall biosynthesis